MTQQFNEDGTYNKTDWKAGDKITATKLNKIEDAIEAVNDHDISRHEEADARLDALEAGVVANKQEIDAKVDALEDTVISNKDAADLDIYRIDQHMTLLDKKIDDGVAEVYGVAESVDGQFNELKAEHKQLGDEIDEVNSQLAHNTEEISVLNKMNNHVTPQMFGATGDGVVDDTNSLQLAINTGKPVYIPPNSIIRVDGTITINNSTVIFGNGDSSILRVYGNIITDDNSSHTLEMYTFKYECYAIYGYSLSIIKNGYHDPTTTLNIHDMTFYFRNNIDKNLNSVVLYIKGAQNVNITNCTFKGDASGYGTFIKMEAEKTQTTMNNTISHCNFYHANTLIHLAGTPETCIYLAGIRLINNLYNSSKFAIKADYVDNIVISDSMIDYNEKPIILNNCNWVSVTNNYIQTIATGQCILMTNNSSHPKQLWFIKDNFLWEANENKDVDGIVVVGETNPITLGSISNNYGTALNRMIVLDNCTHNRIEGNICNNSNTFIDASNNSVLNYISSNKISGTVSNSFVNVHLSCIINDDNMIDNKLFVKRNRSSIIGDGGTLTYHISHGMNKTPFWCVATSHNSDYPVRSVVLTSTHIGFTFDTAPPIGTEVRISWEARIDPLS